MIKTAYQVVVVANVMIVNHYYSIVLSIQGKGLRGGEKGGEKGAGRQLTPQTHN